MGVPSDELPGTVVDDSHGPGVMPHSARRRRPSGKPAPFLTRRAPVETEPRSWLKMGFRRRPSLIESTRLTKSPTADIKTRSKRSAIVKRCFCSDDQSYKSRVNN